MLRFLVNLNFLITNFFSVIFQTREKRIAKILNKKKLKIAFAESCTGGLLSSRMTDLSGSSNYIMQNFVTYANQAKVSLLGVKEGTIAEFGVVSEQIALEMAQGLLDNYECDIAVSITGIAGPTGGSKQKPVGLAYACISDKNRVQVYKIQKNSLICRRLMKYAFSNDVLDYLNVFLK